ncbi:MAG: hypothetical protein ACLQVJ_13120 [Syntrophobacteraceae bacterium]
MDAAMTFALHRKEKKQLDAIAHELSIKEGKKITNGELIRRAIRVVYGVTPDSKRKRAGRPSEPDLKGKSSQKRRS